MFIIGFMKICGVMFKMAEAEAIQTKKKKNKQDWMKL
jgi:hypothetical protein